MLEEIILIFGLLLITTISIAQSFKLMKLKEQYRSKSADCEGLRFELRSSESLRKNGVEYYKDKLKQAESERDEYFNLLKQVDKNKIVTIHRPYKRSQTRYTLAGQYIDEQLGKDWEEAE